MLPVLDSKLVELGGDRSVHDLLVVICVRCNRGNISGGWVAETLRWT